MQEKTGEHGGTNGHPTRPPLMDIEAVAHRLAVKVRHVRRLVAERRIPYLKWGHLLRFDPQEIEEWIRATRVPTQPTVARVPGNGHRQPNTSAGKPHRIGQ